jgi:plastocyanin
MHGRRRRRIAGASGGALLLAAMLVAGMRQPLTIGAKVEEPRGTRVVIQDAQPDCTGGFCYSPGDVSIASGATVTWFNNTATPHTVTRCTAPACGGNGPGDGSDTLGDSGPVANGATYSFTFTRPGRYVYYCSRYGYRVMHGVVTVVDRGPRSAPTPAQPFGIPLPHLPPFPDIPVPLRGVGAGQPHPDGGAHGVWRF